MEEAGRAGRVRSRPASPVQPQKLGHRITAAIFRAVVLNDLTNITEMQAWIEHLHGVIHVVYAMCSMMKLCVFVRHTRSYQGPRGLLACWISVEQQPCSQSSACLADPMWI